MASKLGVREEVRTITLDMIADTGALAVGLPLSLIEQLGLPFLKRAVTTLADGTKKEVDVFTDLKVIIEGREAVDNLRL